MLNPGYNCMVCKEKLHIFEKEDLSEYEWEVCRKLFGFADESNVDRIVAHIEKIECWNDSDVGDGKEG